MLISNHILDSARLVRSPNYSERINDYDIRLIVIHCISLPPKIYGNSYIEDFFCNKLGLIETRRKDVPEGKFTLIFLAATEDEGSAINTRSPEIELTHNWDYEDLEKGRNFGHLAFSVPNIYETCQKLMEQGVVINRPPRDGRMAFIKSPNNISIELLQQGEALEIKDPWKSMNNTGTW